MAPPDPVGPFLALIGGGLLAILVLAWMLRPFLGAAAPGAAAAAAAMTLLAFGLVPELRRAAGGLEDQRKANLTIHELNQRIDCLVRKGHADPAPFVEWLRARLPEDARYVLSMEQVDAPCASMALLPRLAVSEEEDPQYVVFFDHVPDEWKRRFRADDGVERFGPARGLAKVGSG